MSRSRVLGPRSLFGAAMGLAVCGLALLAGRTERTVVVAQDSPRRPVVPDHHVALGSLTCGGTSKAARCHLQPDLPDLGERRDHYSGITEPVRFRELATWREHGGHARAFDRLGTQRARVMADQLAFFESGQKEPDDPRRKDPTKREDCLACHALVLGGPGDRARDASVEGVSCESCHGNAGAAKDADGKSVPGWIDVHAQPGWRASPKETWARHGMTYTPELATWARTCLGCHLGTGDRKVTHMLHAAGHPPLSFELVTDLALAPHHFRERAGEEVFPKEAAPWFYARLWSVGQAVTLAESLRRIERALRERKPLDFALMECFACHHALDTSQATRRAAGWRQNARGFFGEPGEPTLALESWMVSRHVARRLLPKEKLDALASDVVTVFGSATARGIRDPEKAVAAATRAVAAADDLVARAEAAARADSKDPAAQARVTLELLREVASDGEVGFYGFRAAEQQARAIYALYLVGYARTEFRPANDDKIRARIEELFGCLYNARREPRPADFDLPTYDRAREKLAAELPSEAKRR
jgi:hypothetical protein